MLAVFSVFCTALAMLALDHVAPCGSQYAFRRHRLSCVFWRPAMIHWAYAFLGFAFLVHALKRIRTADYRSQIYFTRLSASDVLLANWVRPLQHLLLPAVVAFGVFMIVYPGVDIRRDAPQLALFLGLIAIHALMCCLGVVHLALAALPLEIRYGERYPGYVSMAEGALIAALFFTTFVFCYFPLAYFRQQDALLGVIPLQILLVALLGVGIPEHFRKASAVLFEFENDTA